MTRSETIELLRNLIRIDTSNPPGNEWPAVLLLSSAAQAAGLTARTYRTGENRGNLVVSYTGTFERPLILLSHLDVVPADPSEWTHAPFSGDLVDGEIWGRGTIDTKQLTVMQLAAMIGARRAGFEPTRDIVLVATCDEENGSAEGLLTLLQTDAEIFRGAEVITEGGGFPLMLGDRPVYLCQTGQKSLARVSFSLDDDGAANPFIPTLADAGRAAELVERLSAHRDDAPVPATTTALLQTLASLLDLTGDAPAADPENLYARLAPRLPPTMQTLIRPMLKTTLTPTIWNGGRRDRRPGGVFEIGVDGRLLPTTTRVDLESALRRIGDGLHAHPRIETFDVGFESAHDGRLFSSIRTVMGRRAPAATVVPFISSGGSDGRHLAGLSDVVYGFSPVLPDLTFDRAISMVHGIDERISADSLWFGTQVMTEVLYEHTRAPERG